MKRYLFLLIFSAFAACFLRCNTKKEFAKQTIALSNTSSLDLKDKPVTIRRDKLKIPDGSRYPLLISQGGDTIPSQLDDVDGDQTWDELFFVVNLPAGQSDTIHLSWVDTQPHLPKRTNIRFGVRQNVSSKVKAVLSDTFYADQLPHVIGYQHYQTDGPTWENDKVAFRQYLDGRNSIDVFGKRVSYMTPDDVGIGKDGFTENNYSVMKDWGTDILAVANSAGIGGFSLLFKDQLPRLGITEQDSLNNVDSTVCNILTNGPVRSIINFTYKHWKVYDRIYSAEQTTSIWPGMYAYNNSVRFNNLTGDETMVVGLVNSNTDHKPTEMKVGDWVVLYTFDKQSVNKEWYLGLALILPKANYLGYLEAPKKGSLSTTWLGKLKVENNKPVDYFAVAGWELSDQRFKDSLSFKNYLINLAGQLTSTVTIHILEEAAASDAGK